jgi:ribosomal protein S12 methylthiotransferase
MRRPASGEDNLARVQFWREVCPDITLRSSFIVGFPGETDSEFEELLGFLEDAELDRVGCFTYSPIKGAAANALPNPVPEAVKQERQRRLMLTQARISARKLQHRLGTPATVLVDRIDRQGTPIARSEAEAPEIDGVVHVPGARDARPGEFLRVEITAADEHDLWARPCP